MHSNYFSLDTAQFRRLSDGQNKKLFWACLEVLERTGVRLFHEEALALLRKVGVSISDGNRARIPSGLVEKRAGDGAQARDALRPPRQAGDAGEGVS